MSAAEEIFGAQGFSDATMAGIAERAGVTRSVLTRHFPTKAALFRDVVTVPLVRSTEQWMETWTQRLHTPRTEVELVEEFIADLYANSRAQVASLRLLMFEGDKLDPEIRSHIWEQANVGFTAVIDIARKEYDARGWSTQNLEITIRALISMVLGYVALDPALISEASQDERTVVEHMSALATFGLQLEGPPTR